MTTRSFAVAAACAAITGVALVAQGPSAAPGCDPGNGGISLPQGFCAQVVADNLGPARHMVFSPQGDLYVVLRGRAGGPGSAPAPGVVGLRDANKDGVFETEERFGPGIIGTGIGWRNGHLYVGADERLLRFRMTNALTPAGEPETIVQFPAQRAHTAKPFAFGAGSDVYVHVGAPSNACQEPDRQAGAMGQRPCGLLEMHGGIWKYDADTAGQQHTAGARVVTGIRHTTSLTWHDGALYGAQHGRDQLDTMFPATFKADQNKDLPAEELQRYRPGSNFGWPYCYFDPFQGKRVQGPEYGGDGRADGDCAGFDRPLVTFPAHNAPLDVVFYTATQFPAEYRSGAFVAFHGSWNRAPFEMDGYNIRFVPFRGAEPAGGSSVFASGFWGQKPVTVPTAAQHRPAGLAVGPDGSLYVSDDAKGRIWRIRYANARR